MGALQWVVADSHSAMSTDRNGPSRDPSHLVARVLLALYDDDGGEAKQALQVLAATPPSLLLGALHDWTIARLHRHGATRELQCFEHFRIAASHEPSLPAQLVVLAGLVAARWTG